MTPQDALAAALHKSRAVGSEPHCYCRRIATVDGSIDGPLDPSPYAGFTEDWGFEPQPTGCEQLAAAILADLPDGWVLVNAETLAAAQAVVDFDWAMWERGDVGTVVMRVSDVLLMKALLDRLRAALRGDTDA